MIKSWQTTLFGLGQLAAAVGPQIQFLFDGDPTTTANWNVVVASVSVFCGLAFARDNNKSSESVEVK